MTLIKIFTTKGAKLKPKYLQKTFRGIFLLLLPSICLGEAGYTSANFLKIGMGARAAAMADSFTAVADDATALYWNPAGLGLVRGSEISTTHGQWLQGISNDYVALAHQMGEDGTAGLGFTREGVTSFSSTLEDPLGNFNGTGASASASDWALSAAYAGRLGRWIPGDLLQDTYAGLKVSLLGQDAISSVGSAFSFEVGFLHLLPKEHLALGLDIQNIGTAIQGRSQPVLFKAGVSWYRLHNFNESDRWIFALDADIHDDTGFRPSFGTEYRTPLTSDFNGALRAGLRSTDDQYGLSSLTFGAGIEKTFDGFNAGLDYAFVPYGAIGPTHRFTLNLSLTPPEAKMAAVQTLTAPNKGQVGTEKPQESQDAAPSLLDSGLDRMNQGKLDEALRLFRSEVSIHPDDPRANQLLGTCLFKMGKMEEAQKVFQKAK